MHLYASFRDYTNIFGRKKYDDVLITFYGYLAFLLPDVMQPDMEEDDVSIPFYGYLAFLLQ